MARAIPVLAAVTVNERAATEAAASHLANALSRAAGESWPVTCTFVSELAALSDAAPDTIIVASLQLVLAQTDTPWPSVEQELRRAFATLGETGNPVLICSILRHVPNEGDSEHSERIRRRVRQLNLLVTNLSHDYGALVIDVDRVLADIGARRLSTDYRLGGAAAADIVGRAMASCIVANTLDTFATVAVQDGARLILETLQSPPSIETDHMMTNVMTLGRGRRRQRVATVTAEVEENHVGWLVRQVLKRQVGGRELLAKVLGAIRRRGARQSASLLLSGVARMLKPAGAGRRG
jgi:hypothetical protein